MWKVDVGGRRGRGAVESLRGGGGRVKWCRQIELSIWLRGLSPCNRLVRQSGCLRVTVNHARH